MKGQVFAADIVFATAILFWIFAIVFFLQENMTYKINTLENYKHVERLAEFNSDVIYSQLASNGVFNMSAVSAWFSQSQQNISDAYHFGAYNFSIKLQTLDDRVWASVGSDSGPVSRLVSSVRNGFYNNTLSRLVVKVWYA